MAKRPIVSRWFNVSLNSRVIDKIHYSTSATIAEAIEDVRRALVEHDGYDSDIVVRLARR